MSKLAPRLFSLAIGHGNLTLRELTCEQKLHFRLPLTCVAGGIVSARLKFWRRSRDPKKEVGTQTTTGDKISCTNKNFTSILSDFSIQSKLTDTRFALYGILKKHYITKAPCLK